MSWSSQFWNFRVLWWKFSKFFMSFSKPLVSFSSNFPSHSSLKKYNSSILSLAQTWYTLAKSSPLKWKFLRLLSYPAKIRQVPYVSFKITSQFFFRFFIILQCHHTQLYCKFLAHVFPALDKRIPWKYQVWHFQVFWWKFSKFLIFQTTSQFFFKFCMTLQCREI